MCSRLAFIRSAGIVQSFASRSISAHRASEASEGRTRVRSCHSIRQRVGTDRFDMTSERISFGNSSGRSVGMFCFLGFSKAMPTPEAGFASIRPVFTAKIIISLMRCTSRRTVSSAPRDLIGSSASTIVLALISWTGIAPMVGKTSLSKERQMSFA
ncbi:hypothetical protein SB6417_03665 [Klebsiella pasteurii]|nr:hypothetical protein SB6417_03665 [Klebsiella pasteurii]